MTLRTKILLSCIIAISLFFNLYKAGIAPPCYNSDEASIAYNAYSIFKTGKDEYGTSFPLRFKAFGENKMPVMVYLVAPFVGLFGMEDGVSRIPNTILSALLPIALFFLVKELFKKDSIALLSAFLTATSLSLHIAGRHVHEVYPAVFFLTLTTLFFVKLTKKITVLSLLLFLGTLLIALCTYNFSRIFAAGFLFASFFFFWKQKQGKVVIGSLFCVLLLFAVSDLMNPTSRVQNLLFYNTPGYVQRIQELRQEGGNRLFYNKAFPGISDVFVEDLKYYSPQFLIADGDENPRFGYPSMAPITVIEYMLFFIGLFFLFAKKERYRFLLIFFLLLSPAAASLTWAGISITRSIFLFIPLLILASYGAVALYEQYKDKRNILLSVVTVIILLQGIFLFYSWDFYLNHYPTRALVRRAWQCGYHDMAAYIQKNYDRFDTFYISKGYGQPYIYLLNYLNYPPEKYQSQAQLSEPDEYGFGQVEKFDKFVFTFYEPKPGENVAVIGMPELDYENKYDKFPGIDKVIKITSGTEEIFWIYENPVLNP